MRNNTPADHVFDALDAERAIHQKLWRGEKHLLWLWLGLFLIAAASWLMGERTGMPWGAIVNLSFLIVVGSFYWWRNRQMRLRQVRLRLRPEDHELHTLFRQHWWHVTPPPK